MILYDTIAVEDAAVKITREGFLTAPVKAARTGIQYYTAADLGLQDRAPSERIAVYRAPEEVFARDSLRSFSMIDVTVEHPAKFVDSKNWKDLAVGSVGENVLRDGEFMVLPLILKDADGIDAWKRGKKQLSVGYEADIVVEDGIVPDGQPNAGESYQARQTSIRANHLALCDTARGGPSLRLGDNGDRTMNLKKILVDGFEVETTDAGERAIQTLQSRLADALGLKDKAEASVATLTTEAQAKDAEIVTLKAAVDAAKVTPGQMRDAAKAYANTIARAKALVPTLTIGDDMDEAAVKKAVVASKLGDAAKDWTDAQVDVSFATMAAGVKLDDKAVSRDPLRDTIADGVTNVGDEILDAHTKAKNDRNARYATSHQGTETKQ